jgi:hypothetical protein
MVGCRPLCSRTVSRYFNDHLLSKMRYSSAAAFLCSLVGSANGLPAPAPQASGVSGGQSVPGPVDPSQVLNMPLPSGASGSLRGSDEYQGYNPSNPVDMKSTVIPPEDFELAPGQSEDADLGLYIDLSNVKNPQPIRGGTTGPTEPGPRYVIHILKGRATADRLL